MPKITFVNQNDESNAIIKMGKKALKNRAEDFEFYAKFGDSPHEMEAEFIDDLPHNCATVEEIKDAISQYENLPDLHEYGLCFGYVELGMFDGQDEDYYRFQLSWGGPSEELRFYENGVVEFVFLDWFCGIGFRIGDQDDEHKDWVDWLVDHFDIDSLNFEREREESNYYAIKAERENEKDEL